MTCTLGRRFNFFRCVKLESSQRCYEMDSALVLTPFDLDLANLSLNKNEVLTI